jgi:NADPH-dependent 2,4-dienoyl-CoA reductase/sulfur reductase-like enzyme
MITELFQDNGIRMRMGVEVVGISGHESVSALRLSDGSVVPADLVVAAIGCDPSVGWLGNTGIDLADGVLCDAHGRAADGVYSVGDVARWYDPVTGSARRVEHQATAIEQAHSVARLIATGAETAPIVPFFWSELFGQRILVHGHLEPGVPLTVLAGDPAERRFVAATIRHGRTTGLAGWNMPREFRQERVRLLQEHNERLELLKGSPVS